MEVLEHKKIMKRNEIKSSQTKNEEKKGNMNFMKKFHNHI